MNLNWLNLLLCWKLLNESLFVIKLLEFSSNRDSGLLWLFGYWEGCRNVIRFRFAVLVACFCGIVQIVNCSQVLRYVKVFWPNFAEIIIRSRCDRFLNLLKFRFFTDFFFCRSCLFAILKMFWALNSSRFLQKFYGSVF